MPTVLEGAAATVEQGLKADSINSATGVYTFKPAASVTPAVNGDMVIQLTSNTSLTFKVKGSDGVVRSGSVTLA